MPLSKTSQERQLENRLIDMEWIAELDRLLAGTYDLDEDEPDEPTIIEWKPE